jgi:cation:H+ antiporter
MSSLEQVRKLSIFVPLVVALLSLLIIMKSASYSLNAIVSYAKTTGISEYIIGFFVVSVGTTMPELFTAIFSSLSNNGAISLGNVMGANVIDVTLIMGITAIIGRKILIKDELSKSSLVILGVMAMPLLLGFDGKLSRYDGFILIGSFFIYTISLLRRAKGAGRIKADIKLRHVWKDIFVFGGTVAALILAVRWFVLSTSTMAYMLNIPNFLMGALFVALGTTTPELIVNIKSVMRGHAGVGFGDLIGSACANITLIVGIASIINPIYFDNVRFIASSVFMLLTVGLALFILKRGRISWKNGIFLASIYILFVLMQSIIQV